MPSYDVQTKDGAKYTIDADSDEQLNSAVNDLDPPDTLGGFAENVGKDVVANAKGLVNLGKGLVTHPINTVKAIPGALMEEGKRLGGEELIHGDLPGAGRKLSRAMYEKPVSTGLDAAALVGGVEGVGSKLGLLEDASKVAPAAEAAIDVAPKVPVPEAPPIVAPPAEIPPVVPPAPAGVSKIFAAPLKGFSAPMAETKPLLSSPEFAGWSDKIKAIPGAGAQIPTVGSWEGATEPSVIVSAPSESAEHIAAQIGAGLGAPGEAYGVPQEGVLVAGLDSKTPNGTLYEINFKTPEAIEKWHSEATKYGIQSHAIEPNAKAMFIVDQGDKLRPNISNLIADAHKGGDINGFNERPTEAKLLGPQDYPGALARGAGGVGQAPPAGGAPLGTAPQPDIRPAAAPPLGTGPQEAAPGSVTPPGTPPLTEQLAGKAVGAANDVKDYISRGYEGFAKKPGMTANIADYVQGKSQMMALQQMGFTPGQGRNLGKTAMEVHNAERAIGQYGLDSGIVGPENGLKGMIERNHSLLKTVGKTIGDYREAVDKAGHSYAPGELLQLVKEKLDPIYQKGVTEEHPSPVGLRAPDNGAYQRALAEIKDITSHADAAEAATAINKDATLATKMTQNPGPYTDVANAVSDINNDRIKAVLKPEDQAKYEHALREFGVNKKIQNGLKYKTSGEVKRFGPGSFINNMTQKAMDEVGYRVGAKAMNKLSTSILNNGSVAHSLPSLFKTFINHVEEVGHEISGMSEGGVVKPEMAEWVGKQC